MIYEFLIRNEFNEHKRFFLTADSPTQLYRRILDTYQITKENVVILNEYEETGDWGYTLKTKHTTHESVVNDVSNKARELYMNASRKSEPYKSEAIEKYKYDLIPISCEEDITKIISENKYKKIKVYWELGEKRGQHLYYVLAK